MTLRNTPAVSALAVLSVLGAGCATKKVYLGFNKNTLTKDEQAKLDDAIQKVGGMKNFLIEVEGYADRSGDRTYNRELSRKRADAVVHYLAVEHNVPLRSIRELGV